MPNIAFRLNHPIQKNGQLKTKPVSIQVYYYDKGIEVELSTGIKVLPAKWDGSRVRSIDGAAKINKHLTTLESKLRDVPIDHHDKSIQEQEQIVRSIIKGSSGIPSHNQKKTVLEVVQQFIAQYAKEKETGTVKRYKGLLKKLTDYAKDHPLSFETLDFNFYDSFKNFLYAYPNPNFTGSRIIHDSVNNCYVVSPCDSGMENIGLFDDVVFKYLVNLKTVCAWAEKRGETVHPSYKNWEIIKRDYQPISLTLDELKRIETIPLPRHLDIARDYLALECRTGQRISDLKRFSAQDISGHTWTFTQKKGNRLNAKQIALPLVGYCAPALLILQKYNYELPRISEQNLNIHIKEVCKRTGITQQIFIERYAGNKRIRIGGSKAEFISTHTGRKTFITIALQFMKPQTVMSITGIRSYKTLKHYDGGSEIGTIEAGLRSIEDGIGIMRKAN